MDRISPPQIVGPNGAGKSNAIDALSFALAQEPVALRVRSWSELAARASSAPCAVRLAVSVQPAGSRQLSTTLDVLAHTAGAAGQRAFRINGAAATLQQAKDALLHVGFDVGSASFAVRQHAAARSMDAADLTALLKEASGANAWTAAAATSQQALAKERNTLTRVQADIAVLEELRAKERGAKHAVTNQLRLARQERRGHATMSALADALRRAAARTQEVTLQGAHASLSASKQSMADSSRTLSEAQHRLEACRKQARADAAMAANAAATAERAANAAVEAEAELVHTAVLAAEADSAVVAAQHEWRQTELSSLDQCLAARRLQGARLGALQAAADIDAASEEAAAAARRASAAASGGWFVEQLLGEAIERTQTQLVVAESTRVGPPETRSGVETLQAEHSQTVAALDAQVQRLDILSKARWTAEQRARELACTTAVIPEGLDSALRTVEFAAAEAADRRRRAELQLARYESSDGTAPTLCSTLTLVDDPRLVRCLTALQVIAGPHLGVRLTRSREEAIPILESARQRGDSVRVWPLTVRAEHR